MTEADAIILDHIMACIVHLWKEGDDTINSDELKDWLSAVDENLYKTFRKNPYYYTGILENEGTLKLNSQSTMGWTVYNTTLSQYHPDSPVRFHDTYVLELEEKQRQEKERKEHELLRELEIESVKKSIAVSQSVLDTHDLVSQVQQSTLQTNNSILDLNESNKKLNKTTKITNYIMIALTFVIALGTFGAWIQSYNNSQKSPSKASEEAPVIKSQDTMTQVQSPSDSLSK